ncbi:FAD-dependent oxidoreductase [Kribbella solani]|uniref:FAD-dependent oxidoreductase n=1 Tax=Kribbella solani TaxID=236067 RepID=UPI0029B4476D|nr:FAD-dependent oxidoreductase [Kribbella solani]MDX2968635.1 FAD-dependent oxidoreductase [Kribbella solani]
MVPGSDSPLEAASADTAAQESDWPEILVVGGGLGGIAAALAAAELGARVLLTEESAWLGGQLTSQGVPPDENGLIETIGGTGTYRRLRQGIRAYYREHRKLTDAAARSPFLNPGTAHVSRIAHEPRAAVAAIDELCAPLLATGRMRIRRGWTPVSASSEADTVRSVTFATMDGDLITVEPSYVLDATEDGGLLDLVGCEHVLGSEAQADTGEPRALTGAADPLDQQAITWCLAVEHRPGERHEIGKPADYDSWRTYRPDFWPGPLLSFTGCNPHTPQEPITWPLFADPGGWSLWTYRRIRDGSLHDPATTDISILNWPQNDYFVDPVVGTTSELREARLAAARNLSLSLLYWLQTEAPRSDGGTGYPELAPAADVFGTADGLALRPYLREGRRIQAVTTVVEQDIAFDSRPDGPRRFADSVGVGHYRIDLHPSTGGRNYIDFAAHPFQVPLGALIPVRLRNLVPAAKNIGSTHITNGCYRLHPVEWTIGEAAGVLAAFCLRHNVQPSQVQATAALTEQLQSILTDKFGTTLRWPADYAEAYVAGEVAKRRGRS